MTIGSATRRPIPPLALEELARYILWFVVPLAEPPGHEIDADATGEDKENAGSTLGINEISQTSREPSDATTPSEADQRGSRWVATYDDKDAILATQPPLMRDVHDEECGQWALEIHGRHGKVEGRRSKV